MAQTNLTYAQAIKLLEQFGGDEETVIAITTGEGHSGKGIYVGSPEYPEDGSIYLGPEV